MPARTKVSPGKDELVLWTKLHRGAVERAVKLGGRVQFDRVRRVERALRVRANELHAVPGRDLIRGAGLDPFPFTTKTSILWVGTASAGLREAV